MPPTAGDIVNVRREAIGDSGDTTTLPGADIVYYWDNGGEGAVVLTAALCCEMLAAKYAGAINVNTGGQSLHAGTLQEKYERRADKLRRRYYGSGTVTVTRSHDVGKDASEYSA